jgi:hypothetical protein
VQAYREAVSFNERVSAAGADLARRMPAAKPRLQPP